MPPQQQQGQQPDNSMAPVWIIIGLFVVAGLIWYNAHAYIVMGIFKMKLWEAELVRLFTDQMTGVIKYLQITDPALVKPRQVLNVSEYIGNFIRYPIMVVLAVLAVILYLGNTANKYRRTYSMKTLSDLEGNNWPMILPVLKADLANQNLDEGPWAVALSPLGFSIKEGLLKKQTALRGGGLGRMNTPTLGVLRGRAKKVFTLQLGAYWEGPAKLPAHTRFLFGLFAAKINRDRDVVTRLLDQVAQSTVKGRLNLSGGDQLVLKYYDTKLVQRIIHHHAYVLTMMASMIEKVRDDGVFPTATFLWLKAVDRPLWYMLNSVGRQTAFAEVSGAFAHWKVEKELKRRIIVPMVDEAVTGLELAVKEIKYVPEEHDEHLDET